MKRKRNKKKRYLLNKNDEEKIKIKEEDESHITIKKNKHFYNYINLSKKKRKKKFYIKKNIFISFIIILISICFLLLFSSIIKNKRRNSFINNIEYSIKYNITNSSTKERNYLNISSKEALRKGLNYVDLCKRGLLINNRTFINIKEPKISVIIPVYNSEKVIKSTIRTIQNQDMIDIEIVLVNDSPNDNTTNIIEEMQKEDPRIKIIYNKKSMGTLYSRSIGALEAKGRYITTIDNDDFFIDKDLFDTIYEETNKEYFDIISFKAFACFGSNKYQDYYLADNRNRQILYQPELGIFSYRVRDPLFNNNILLWGKLIKSTIYKEAVNKMGKERYSNYLLWAEDTSIFFIICSIAQSYKFIKKFGILHFRYNTSSSQVLPKDHYIFGDIFLVDIIFDFSKNEYKKNAIYKLIYSKYKKNFIISKEYKKVIEYLKSVIKKILNCEYIDEKDKNELKKHFKEYV